MNTVVHTWVNVYHAQGTYKCDIQITSVKYNLHMCLTCTQHIIPFATYVRPRILRADLENPQHQERQRAAVARPCHNSSLRMYFLLSIKIQKKSMGKNPLCVQDRRGRRLRVVRTQSSCVWRYTHIGSRSLQPMKGMSSLR
jgi:hypothetical protein